MKKTTMDVRSAVILTLRSVSNSIAWTAKTTCLAVHKPKKHKFGGFTLIELMIVIAIIGILAAVAIPNFISYRDKTYCSAAESDLKNIENGLYDYFAIPSRTCLYLPLDISTDGKVAGFSSPVFSKLSGNTAKLESIIINSIKCLKITVDDLSGRCPIDYQDGNICTGMSDGGNGCWSGTKPGKYIKILCPFVSCL